MGVGVGVGVSVGVGEGEDVGIGVGVSVSVGEGEGEGVAAFLQPMAPNTSARTNNGIMAMASFFNSPPFLSPIIPWWAY